MRHTRKSLNEDAARHNLSVAYYNPGGNPQFKVVKGLDAEYFRSDNNDTLFRATTAKEVAAFLEGYDQAIERLYRENRMATIRETLLNG